MTTPIPNAAPYNGLRKTERTLPTAWYIDPAHHAREMAAIFHRHWLYVGRSETVPGPRAYRTFEIGTQSILLVRDEAGTLHAFHNTCRHRGTRLVEWGSGTLGANCITCPYHAWTYRLDGTLARVFSHGPADDFDKEALALFHVAVAEWRGFIFINLAGAEAVPFTESIRRNWSLLENWPMEQLRIGHVETRILACNWKLFWENNSECLHCPGVHPELCERVPIFARGLLGQRDDPNWREHAKSEDPKYRGGLRAGDVTLSMDGKAHGETFPKLTEAERRNGQNFLTIAPGVFIIGNVDYVRVLRIRPVDVASTEVEMVWLFPPSTLADPAIDIMNNVEIGRQVFLEDAAICEAHQAGLYALPFQEGVLLPEEHLVKRFQDWVREAIADGDKGDSAGRGPAADQATSSVR